MVREAYIGITRSYHDVDEQARYHNDLPERLLADEPGDVVVALHFATDGFPIRAGIDADVAAQLAVHLDHELDLVARHRGPIALRRCRVDNRRGGSRAHATVYGRRGERLSRNRVTVSASVCQQSR